MLEMLTDVVRLERCLSVDADTCVFGTSAKRRRFEECDSYTFSLWRAAGKEKVAQNGSVPPQTKLRSQHIIVGAIRDDRAVVDRASNQGLRHCYFFCD
jgi:hypothetical protein